MAGEDVVRASVVIVHYSHSYSYILSYIPLGTYNYTFRSNAGVHSHLSQIVCPSAGRNANSRTTYAGASSIPRGLRHTRMRRQRPPRELGGEVAFTSVDQSSRASHLRPVVSKMLSDHSRSKRTGRE